MKIEDMDWAYKQLGGSESSVVKFLFLCLHHCNFMELMRGKFA